MIKVQNYVNGNFVSTEETIEDIPEPIHYEEVELVEED